MAGTGAIDDVVGVPFGPLNEPLLIDGPRPRKTRFFSNFDDDGPNYSSDNSENDDTAMSDRHWGYAIGSDVSSKKMSRKAAFERSGKQQC